MSKRPTRRKPEDNELLRGLKFVMAAQYRPDESRAVSAYQSHCRFFNGYVVGFNGVISAGFPYADDVQLCPNTHYFIKALEKARGAFSLTQLDNKSLVINAGSFRATVPCVESYYVDGMAPDPSYWPMTDELRRCLIQAGLFCSDGAQTVLAASIITLDYSLVGTDGVAMIESYLGLGIPKGLVIPVAFAKAVNDVDAAIVGFGFSDISFTVHFDNGAWLRTQLYQASVPDVSKILDTLPMHGLTAIPPTLFEAIDAIEAFSETGSATFQPGKVRSHHEEQKKGAEHDCAGLVADGRYNLKYINKMRAVMTHCDFVTGGDRAIFAGDKVRALSLIHI